MQYPEAMDTHRQGLPSRPMPFESQRSVRFSANFGQTAAFAAGFAHAAGRLIVTSDGDLQNDPADIPRMIALAGEHDIVCGWRKDRQDAYLTRHLPSVAANWLISLVTGIRLHDNGCSLKVFQARVVKPLRLLPGMHRYLPAIAARIGPRVAIALLLVSLGPTALG